MPPRKRRWALVAPCWNIIPEHAPYDAVALLVGTTAPPRAYLSRPLVPDLLLHRTLLARRTPDRCD
ncbi:MAG: hypothetical protein ABEL04_02425 [Salinibacter sp.]